MKKYLILVLTLFILLGTSIAACASYHAQEIDRAQLSIGGMAPGDYIKDIYKIYDKPDRVLDEAYHYWHNSGDMQTLIWNDLMKIIIVRKEDHSKGIIETLITYSPKLKTPAGIHCEMTLDDLKKAYHHFLENKGIEKGNRVFVIRSGISCIKFTIEGKTGFDKKIIMITMGSYL